MLGIRHHRQTAIDLYHGDITRFVCDAMGNAANEGLRGGGGVDGAIHAAGGPDILKECQAIGSCPPGQAVVTTAGKLPAKKLIHAVGPIWQGGSKGEAETLASCYTQSLTRAVQEKLPHIALPSISTGVYAYPLAEASRVALKAVLDFLNAHPEGSLRRITFVLFDRTTYQAYQDSLFALFPETDDTPKGKGPKA